MSAELTAAMMEARALLAGFRSRATSSISESHFIVCKTEQVIKETREMVVLVEGLIPLWWPGAVTGQASTPVRGAASQ